MPAGERPVVAVFGSYDRSAADEAYALARRVGRRLAEWGYAVANGGYGGTMEASARGAVEAGGHTIGVTCTCWRARPNAYIREVIDTAGLAERIERFASVARAGFVVLPGATGTLLELAWVWEHLAKGLMTPRPIVCVGEFWRPVVERIASARPGCDDGLAVVAGPDELSRYFPACG